MLQTPEEIEMAEKNIELLRQISFGNQVAEEEVRELASYFVETNQWSRIANGEIDIIRGEKGSGKSAIYSLLMSRTDSFFDKNILLVAAETPRGTTVFQDLITDPPTTETEFIVLWKLYILTIGAHQLRDYDIKGKNSEKIYSLLEEANLLEKQFTLKGVLRTASNYARRLVNAEAAEGGITVDPQTLLPIGITGKILFKEPRTDLRKLGYVSVDGLIAILNEVLEENGLKIWVLLDRLDVAFVESHELEANALRALMRAYADLRGDDNISLKIFLREDIWKRITESGMREASHLIRYVILSWNEGLLRNLIIRRLLNNDIIINQFELDKNKILSDANLQEEVFYRFFPKQVEQGPQKAATFNWLITRCADGTKKTAPRELIHLLKCIVEKEIIRLENGGPAPEPDQLFDRSVFKAALPEVSGARLNQYLYAEYPAERPFIAKMEGQKAEQTPESLAELWSLTREESVSKAERLVELGFFEERGSQSQPTYWVPFLYRDALSLIQGKAETDYD